MYTDNDFRIYHHGILGQKWGKMQGPPYPLDASDHSSAERKAGWRKSLDGGSKRKESLGLRLSKKSEERRASKTEKLLNEIKNADLSSDKAKYKYAKKLAKALNAEDQARAGNVAANEYARNDAKSFREEAKSMGLGKNVDRILDAAESTSLDAKEYNKLASNGQARIKNLLKTADELGLSISSEEGSRSVGSDDDYTEYFVPGVYYKAVKGSKSEIKARSDRLDKLEKQDSGKHTEITRKNEVEDFVSDRYDQLRKTMGSDDAMRKIVSEARTKYPNAFEEDENVYKNRDRDWWDDDDW